MEVFGRRFEKELNALKKELDSLNRDSVVLAEVAPPLTTEEVPLTRSPASLQVDISQEGDGVDVTTS